MKRSFALISFFILPLITFSQTPNMMISINPGVAKFSDWKNYSLILFSVSYQHEFENFFCTIMLSSLSGRGDFKKPFSPASVGEIAQRRYKFIELDVGKPIFIFKKPTNRIGFGAGGKILHRQDQIITYILPVPWYEPFFEQYERVSLGGSLFTQNELFITKHWSIETIIQYHFYSNGKSFTSLNLGIGYHFSRSKSNL